MLTYWIRPALITLVWIVVAAFTLSELTTVAPSLGLSGSRPPLESASRQRARGGHPRANKRLAVAP